MENYRNLPPSVQESREEAFYDRIKDKMRVEIGLVAELLMSVPNFQTVPLDDQVGMSFSVR